MVTRYEVAAVPLQGGYVAKQCPVRAQNDAIVPAEEVEVSPELQRRFDRGISFEAEVIADLAKLHGKDMLVLRDEMGHAERLDKTVESMAKRVPIIAGGRLPDDLDGRRAGKPDLLIATEGGYRTVDVKHHRTLDHIGDANTKWPALVSALATPGLDAAAVEPAHELRRMSGAKGDTLQLAHYQRMLEAAGLAADGPRMAGLIGVERVVIWYDLDAPMWQTKAKSDGKKRKYRTTMERYDFEFDFRLDIIAVATTSPDRLLVEPARCGECPQCPWHDYCIPLLEESDDLTLLPGLTWDQRLAHHAHGVTTRKELAQLDHRTATLISQKVQLEDAMEAAETVPPTTPIYEVPKVKGRAKQREVLEAAGVATAADLLALDPDTAAYDGSGVGDLASQIDLALAATGPEPIYRRRGVEEVRVPRADIEVDVDMENIEEGVYLWGTLRTDRAAGTPSEYLPFVRWESPTDEAIVAVFHAFWKWLVEQQRSAVAAGQTFAAYYYTDAETRYLREYGAVLGISEDIEAFVASDAWVDVNKVVSSHLITGTGMGLKAIAPLAGFAWDVDDPGGGVSMQWYDWATGISEYEEPEQAQGWLLRYNRGDVEATLAIREWLGRRAPILPIEASTTEAGSD